MRDKKFIIPLSILVLLLAIMAVSCEKPTGPSDEPPEIHHEWKTVLNTHTWPTSLIEVPSHPGTLLFTGTQVFLDSCIGGLYRSTDWGATWTELYDGMDFIGPSYVDGDPPRVYATTGTKYRSMLPVQSFDAGLTWSTITHTLPALYPFESFYLVFSHPKDPSDIILFSTYLPGSLSGRNWRSFDGGKNWSLDSTYFLNNFNFIKRNPYDPKNIVGTTSGYFFHSYDNGTTWNQLYSFGTRLGNIQFMDDESQWILTNNNDSMYETFDGGETFSAIGEGLPEDVEIEEFVLYKNNILAFIQFPTGEDKLFLMDMDTKEWTQWTDRSWIGVTHLVMRGEYIFVVNTSENNECIVDRY